MLDASEFKEQLHDRIEDYMLEFGRIENDHDEFVAGLVSEVYAFLTDRDEGEEMTFPIPEDGEEDAEEGNQRT